MSRSERIGVLDRGVPGTLEAGEGTGELVCEEDVSDAELLPEIYRKQKCQTQKGVFCVSDSDFSSSGKLVKPVFRIRIRLRGGRQRGGTASLISTS